MQKWKLEKWSPLEQIPSPAPHARDARQCTQQARYGDRAETTEHTPTTDYEHSGGGKTIAATRVKWFFVRKPRIKANFLLVLASATSVAFVVIPTIGFFTGNVAQTIADNWVIFIATPIALSVVVWSFMLKPARELRVAGGGR